MLTEPILINSGSLMPDDGYLAGLIDLCRKYGAVSIFDEVITGFRIALGGAREYFRTDAGPVGLRESNGRRLLPGGSRRGGGDV